MSRLTDMLQEKRRAGKKVLSIYLTAGFPSAEATLPLLQAIELAGADLIELGVPFSDPQADGATIQAASFQALKGGATLAGCFEHAARFADTSGIPLLMMGYANPFMRYGWQQVISKAAAAGVSGFIIPDLPPEESRELHAEMQAQDQSLVYLVSPNTDSERLAHIDRLTTSFVYAVSLTGVTGARAKLPATTRDYLSNLRERLAHPALVGFGVGNPTTARLLAPHCDGVIIGSALINIISKAPDVASACKAAAEFVEEMKHALDEVS